MLSSKRSEGWVAAPAAVGGAAAAISSQKIWYIGLRRFRHDFRERLMEGLFRFADWCRVPAVGRGSAEIDILVIEMRNLVAMMSITCG
jgi:hypothetical protein